MLPRLRPRYVAMGSAPVMLVAHDPTWASKAVAFGERFAAVAGDNLVRVHHIGSTSIPTIEAKPIIDLMPVVLDLEALDALPFEDIGFEPRGEYGIQGRRFFTHHDVSTGTRLVNVHCFADVSGDAIRHLAFRDYLFAHPDIARAYEAEKQRAREAHPNDVFGYTDEKAAWIRRVEAEAVTWYRAGGDFFGGRVGG